MAPSAKTKTNVANGAGPKVGKPVAEASPSASGNTTPIGENGSKAAFGSRTTKPDKAAYDKEQEELKAQIAVLQEKMTAVRAKIDAGQGGGPSAERRNELRAELDQLRAEQGNSKISRQQLENQLTSLKETISRKIKDLQASKSKTQFRSTAELDAHIRSLEKAVETGSLKLAEEKRTLQEISQFKRMRKTIESFQAEQDSIDQDRAKEKELRELRDDPQAKAVSERYDAIKAELDEIRKEGDESHKNRNKLFDERTEIKTQLDALFERKRSATTKYREENDKFYAQLAEDRAKRAERLRRQREEDELAKKRETAMRLREEAEMPAYQAQIEDCQTIIDFFSGKANPNARLSTTATNEPLFQRAEVANVPKLELRQVEADTQGLVARKKKGEDDDAYFVSGKSAKSRKGKGNKKSAQSTDANGDTVEGTANANGKLNLPLPMLTALLSLSIPPPAAAGDYERVVGDLQTKKAWFEANQARVTQENITKAEANIAKIMGTIAGSGGPAPPNGSGERPPEPAPTPLEGTLEVGVSSDEVDAEIADKAAKGEVEVAA